MPLAVRKVKGFNQLKAFIERNNKTGRFHPKKLIAEKDWILFNGDIVEIVKGRKDVGKSGKVVSMVKERGQVFVEGLNKGIKHQKPSPETPEGGRIEKEMAIPYDNVRLVDPVYQRPAFVKWHTFYDPIEEKDVKKRISLLSNQIIPLPTTREPFPDKKGQLDVSKKLLLERTFVPNIFEHPFPNSVRNEMHRLSRRGKNPERIFWF